MLTSSPLDNKTGELHQAVETAEAVLKSRALSGNHEASAKDYLLDKGRVAVSEWLDKMHGWVEGT